MIVRSASSRRVFGAFLISALVLATSLGDAATVAAASTPSQRELIGWLRTLSAPAGPVVEAITGDSLQYGADNRLTVLILGSDSRSSGIGLTDAILIASLNRSTNAVSIASIPRDIGRFPNPSGGYYPGRVNSLVKRFGLTTTERAIERALAVEIDYNVLITFRGFDFLVDEVDSSGISVSNPKAIRDSKFWDDPNGPRGVYFPAGQNTLYSLPYGPLCNGLWQTRGTSSAYWCDRALPFVRSRKGSGNSDFARAGRQQAFLWGTLRRVILRGSGSALNSLAAEARSQLAVNHVRGSLPTSDSAAASFFMELQSAYLSRQVVFSPSTYATRIPGTSGYQLKLSAVRAWTAANMR